MGKKRMVRERNSGGESEWVGRGKVGRKDGGKANGSGEERWGKSEWLGRGKMGEK
jgi:hypothetical protein